MARDIGPVEMAYTKMCESGLSVMSILHEGKGPSEAQALLSKYITNSQIFVSLAEMAAAETSD